MKGKLELRLRILSINWALAENEGVLLCELPFERGKMQKLYLHLTEKGVLISKHDINRDERLTSTGETKPGVQFHVLINDLWLSRVRGTCGIEQNQSASNAIKDTIFLNTITLSKYLNQNILITQH